MRTSAFGHAACRARDLRRVGFLSATRSSTRTCPFVSFSIRMARSAGIRRSPRKYRVSDGCVDLTFFANRWRERPSWSR